MNVSNDTKVKVSHSGQLHVLHSQQVQDLQMQQPDMQLSSKPRHAALIRHHLQSVLKSALCNGHFSKQVLSPLLQSAVSAHQQQL
jgi:hypothetical protein